MSTKGFENSQKDPPWISAPTAEIFGGSLWEDDRSYEMEMRIRNLVWTISGDYSLELKPNLETFSRSPNIAVYDGVKQGGLAKYFDPDAISMYLLKKVYCHAEQSSLIETAQLCIEAAVGHRLDAERHRRGQRSVHLGTDE